MLKRTQVIEVLREVGRLDDAAIDPADTALWLASADRLDVSQESYRAALSRIAEDVRSATARSHSVDMQIKALSRVLHETWGFAGDTETYDDPRNANLMHVIDRKRGLPVALGILWLHAGRAYQADLVGLAFPSHFLVRLAARGQRAILDVFHGGRPLEASDLRRMLKEKLGADQEIAPEHYAPVASRDVLVRLQNNLKVRAVAAGDLPRALEVLETMTALAPDRGELWQETALVQSRLGNLKTAIATLEGFLADAPRSEGERGQVEDLLRRLRSSMN